MHAVEKPATAGRRPLVRGAPAAAAGHPPFTQASHSHRPGSGGARGSGSAQADFAQFVLARVRRSRRRATPGHSREEAATNTVWSLVSAGRGGCMAS